MEPIVGCLLYYWCSISLCYILHKYVITSLRSDLQPYATEFVSTLQVILCVFENGAIYNFYGVYAFIVCLTLVGIVYRLTTYGAYCNPAAVIVDTISGTRPVSAQRGSILVGIELLAGYAAYQVCRKFWMLHLHSVHTHRHTTDYLCVSDLKVSVMYGMIAEAVAACIVQVVDEAGYRKIRNTMQAHVFGSIVVALTVVAGLEVTGMYLNPVLATIVTYGCTGAQPMEHMLVYWVGPIIGLLAAKMISR